MQTQTAKDLLHTSARGPEAPAWERFVERYGPAIEEGVRRALSRSSVRRRGERRVASGPAGVADLADLQDDMVQECYCRLLEDGRRRLTGFRGLAEPEARAWLARLAERCTRDRLRWARAGKRGGRSLPSRVRDAVSVPDPVASPEREAIGRQELRSFVLSCRRLAASERDARILRLVFLEGLTSREVASVSRGRLSASGVDTVVHRFRARLRSKGRQVPRR
jgi:RNA polymerase sigma factor (sigma-70 family)